MESFIILFLHPCVKDAIFMYIPFLTHEFTAFIAAPLISFDRRTNSAFKDLFCCLGMTLFTLSVCGYCYGIHYHSIARIVSLLACCLSSLCGSTGILLYLLKEETDELYGSVFQIIGIFLSACSLLSRFCVDLEYLWLPYLWGLLIFNVGNAIVIFHKTNIIL